MVGSERTTTATKPLLVGGDFLGRHWSPCGEGRHFEPLVTDTVSDGQRFLLLPHRRYVLVFSYLTGRRVGVLSLNHPKRQDDNNDGVNKTTDREDDDSSSLSYFLESAALAWIPLDSSIQQNDLAQLMMTNRNNNNNANQQQSNSTDETSSRQVLYVGCSDGCLLEFPIADLVRLRPSTQEPCELRDYQLPGPVYRPSRRIRVSKHARPIHFLSFPTPPERMGSNKNNSANTILGYALIAGADEKENNKGAISTFGLTRMRLPLPSTTTYDETTTLTDSGVEEVDLTQARDDENGKPSTTLQSLHTLQSTRNRARAKHRKDLSPPIALFSRYCAFGGKHHGNGNNAAGVVVLVAQQLQIAVFLDKDSDADGAVAKNGEDEEQQQSACTRAVYALQTNNDRITAVALSPNGRNVACGHVSGTIYVLTDFVNLYHDHLVQMQRFNLMQATTTTTREAAAADSEDAVTLPILSQSKPSMPSIIRRKLHWHAHPVAALSYESNSVAQEPFLYSGGVESVLCGWQLAQGVYKPSLILPRIALEGIAHICHVDSGSSGSSSGTGASVLVYCSNGTLLSVNAHNLRAMKWKVSSIPRGTNKKKAPKNTKAALLEARQPRSIKMRAVPVPSSTGKEPRSIALFGSPPMAGFVHWLDPENHLIHRSLEVAPFNRVSRAETHDLELPRPIVTHAAWNDSSTVLLTVDVVSTEVSSYGAEKRLSDGSLYGSVTSLKFWHGSNAKGRDGEYRVVAELSSPHGKPNTICAAALSASGKLACTVSREESSFRVWQRQKQVVFHVKKKKDSGDHNDTDHNDDHDHDDEDGMAPWFCRYRIAFPMGFSNQFTGARAVSFSADDSTLAIGFGNFCTVWDVEEQVLLAALPHANDDWDPASLFVNRIQFLPSTSRLCDMMLTCSQRHVVLQSPFGHCGASNLGWCWSLPEQGNSGRSPNDSDEKKEKDKDSDKREEKNALVVSCAEYIGSNDSVAVALYDPAKREATLLLIDAVTGNVNPRKEHIELPGMILDIVSLLGPSKSSSWDDNDSALDLMFVTQEGRTFRLSKKKAPTTQQEPQTQSTTTKRRREPVMIMGSSTIPSLPNHIFNNNPRKRAPQALSSLELASVGKRTKTSVEHFGEVAGQSSVGGDNELPLLRGAFAKAFLARHLFKNEENEE